MVYLIPPLPYTEFLNLFKDARLLLTDFQYSLAPWWERLRGMQSTNRTPIFPLPPGEGQGEGMQLTDSGGIQEETTTLGVPCLTLRENTERPITVTEGTNVIVGTDPARIVAEATQVLAGQGKQGRRPDLWDGRASERIVQALMA